MIFPSKETVERLKEQYPVGTRIILRKMDDIQAPPIGTMGTVQGVDDAGSLSVKWECGITDENLKNIFKHLGFFIRKQFEFK